MINSMVLFADLTFWNNGARIHMCLLNQAWVSCILHILNLSKIYILINIYLKYI